ncbi:unnamed protein product [Scytosiphon promiscuus]
MMMAVPVSSRSSLRRYCAGASASIAFFLVGALLVGPAAGARESSRGYDADLTLFSPEGRLYQVEYVMRGVGHYGCLVVGVHGEGCCVVACRRELPDELVYPESVSSIFRVTDDIYAAATGLTGDVRHQVKRARLQALEYKRQYGSPMPSRLLTLAMADAAQVNTQHAALRPMACVSLIISVDDPTGPALFRVEPSGQVFQAWGTAAGRGSAACVEVLEDTLKAAAAAAAEEDEDKDEDEEEGVGGHDKEAKKSASAAAADGDSFDSTGVDGDAGDARETRPARSKQGGGESGDQATEPPDEHSSGRGGLSTGRGSMTGFGALVRGERETVELALRALSKASSGKDADPLTDRNVEIAIASRESGIRVCSRKEVRGFLGKVVLPVGSGTPKSSPS